MEGLDLVQLWTTAPSLVTVVIVLQWLKIKHEEMIRREKEYAETILAVYQQYVNSRVESSERLAALSAEINSLRHETIRGLRDEFHALKNNIQEHVLARGRQDLRDARGGNDDA